MEIYLGIGLLIAIMAVYVVAAYYLFRFIDRKWLKRGWGKAQLLSLVASAALLFVTVRSVVMGDPFSEIFPLLVLMFVTLVLVFNRR